jgi:plasmid maintenance system antidote protein VapI
MSSNVGSAWFNLQNANDLSAIQPETANEFLNKVCPSLSKNTVKRRAQTLKSWLKIFLEYW